MDPTTPEPQDDPVPSPHHDRTEAPGTDASDSPDVFFTLNTESDSETTELATPPISEPTTEAEHEDREYELRRSADKLATEITELLLPSAPPRWQRLRMRFSVTVAAVSGDAEFLHDDVPTVVEIPTEAGELVQALRALTIAPDERAWWLVSLTREESGAVGYEFGYGDVAFPADRLLPTAAYRADLAQFPRERLPVWLAARLWAENEGRSLPATLAAARIERAPATPVRFLPAPTVWARWAVVAAAAVAIGTEWGPRILGATGVFEGTDGSGASLHLLPRGRAVLSGGVWNAPELDAAYNDGAPVPAYYAGAPDWLDDSVLNHRAHTAQLSFCYWWDGAAWSSGQSPAPTTIGPAIPGMWTPETVIDIVCRVLGATASRPAVAALLTAAESGSVTSALAEAAFHPAEPADLAGAWSQLAVAGLTD